MFNLSRYFPISSAQAVALDCFSVSLLYIVHYLIFCTHASHECIICELPHATNSYELPTVSKPFQKLSADCPHTGISVQQCMQVMVYYFTAGRVTDVYICRFDSTTLSLIHEPARSLPPPRSHLRGLPRGHQRRKQTDHKPLEIAQTPGAGAALRRVDRIGRVRRSGASSRLGGRLLFGGAQVLPQLVVHLIVGLVATAAAARACRLLGTTRRSARGGGAFACAIGSAAIPTSAAAKRAHLVSVSVGTSNITTDRTL